MFVDKNKIKLQKKTYWDNGHKETVFSFNIEDDQEVELNFDNMIVSKTEVLATSLPESWSDSATEVSDYTFFESFQMKDMEEVLTWLFDELFNNPEFPGIQPEINYTNY